MGGEKGESEVKLWVRYEFLHTQSSSPSCVPRLAGLCLLASCTLSGARGIKKAFSSLHSTAFRLCGCLAGIYPPPHPRRIPSWPQNSSAPVTLHNFSSLPGRETNYRDTFRKPTGSQDLISHQPSSCNSFQQSGSELNQ